ncbi:hypothetical protein LMG18102_03900 [Ralstonia mannitolilytica]|nr:hypothetical protein LMG18102_03900 [Ralstonia mannitolilytica]
MHAEDCVAGEAFEQAVLDHFACAATAFFGWLEDQVNRPAEVAVFRQVMRGAQEHGRVAIVSTRVHFPFMPGAMFELVRLGQRQGVHVGAQADALAVAVADDADEPRLAEAAVHLDAPFRQLGGDEVGGALLFKAQFGMRVDVASQRLDFRLRGLDFWNQLHGMRVF